jgi:hypothetical protein
VRLCIDCRFRSLPAIAVFRVFVFMITNIVARVVFSFEINGVTTANCLVRTCLWRRPQSLLHFRKYNVSLNSSPYFRKHTLFFVSLPQLHFLSFRRHLTGRRQGPPIPNLTWLPLEQRKSVGLVLLQQELESIKMVDKIRWFLKQYARQGIIANEAIYKYLVKLCLNRESFELAKYLFKYAQKHKGLTQEIYELPILIAAKKNKNIKKYTAEAEIFFFRIRRRKWIPSKEAFNAMFTLYKKLGAFQKAKNLLNLLKELSDEKSREYPKRQTSHLFTISQMIEIAIVKLDSPATLHKICKFIEENFPEEIKNSPHWRRSVKSILVMEKERFLKHVLTFEQKAQEKAKYPELYKTKAGYLRVPSYYYVVNPQYSLK